MAGLSGWHLVILLGVVVLLFGAKKLPEMARSVGQSARIFKGEMKGMAADDHAPSEQAAPGRQHGAAEPPTAPAAPTTPAPIDVAPAQDAVPPHSAPLAPTRPEQHSPR